MKKVISVDLDGVLNMYNGNFDENNIPPMRSGAKEFLQQLSENYRIEIFTTRNKILTFEWLQKNGLSEYIVEITNVKNPYTSVFIDDRAIHFDGVFENVLNKINNFQPHWKTV